jgi:hypothetical protein
MSFCFSQGLIQNNIWGVFFCCKSVNLIMINYDVEHKTPSLLSVTMVYVIK